MLRRIRFWLTLVVLKLLGWKAERGRDSKGNPYVAFMVRGAANPERPWLYAHVYVHNLPLDPTLQLR